MLGKIHLKGALIGAGTAVLLGIAPVAAAEMDDLKEQIEALKDRLSKLEKGGTSVSISGYVKGDFYIDNRDDRGGTFYAPTIPLKGVTDPEDDDGSFGAHAGQSRFRLGTSTPTSFGALNTLVEGGFNPYDTSHKFRLRQAYGELGPVLAGQAWSILGDDHTYADTIDFDGPVGVIATVRKPQLRLTLPMGEGFTGQMAVEPAIRGNELPTFLAALRYSSGWGAVNLTGAVGRYDDGGQNVSAHAIHVGAHVNATDATRLMATFNMSKGVDLANGPDGGRIWGGGSGALPDASDDLKAMETMGGNRRTLPWLERQRP